MKHYAIIPAYNEEETIEEVILRCKKVGVFPVVVDDGSTDNTYKIAQNLTIVLRNFKNKGKGEALKKGFNFLKNLDEGYVAVIDADLQFDPYEIPKLMEALKDADYVIGCRDWRQVPFRHQLGNLAWIKTFNFLFKTNMKDTNCGFVAMKTEVMEKLNVSSGYIVDNDMLIQALRLGCKIKNIPVSVKYNHKRDLLSGVRMVLGVLFFLFKFHSQMR